MKVVEKSTGQEMEVFGIYAVENKEYFCCSPKQFEGLLTFSSEEVEVSDPYMNREFIAFENEIAKGLYFSPLIKEDLLDGLLECEPAAYKRFSELLNNGNDSKA